MHHPLEITATMFDLLCGLNGAITPGLVSRASISYLTKWVASNYVTGSSRRSTKRKISIDQQASEEGYKFIREFGPKANNRKSGHAVD